MAHGKSVLAEFQAGETRTIFARRRDGTPGLHYLADGAADAEREWTRAELLCPVEDCPTPEFTSVNNGDRRRDHYRHLRGQYRHSEESLFHLEGKAQIARWVETSVPGASAVIERASNKERERIADVMVTLADGQRIAIEIQYASLTPRQWQIRHDSYAAQGITDVWLFGHTGAQLNSDHRGRVTLNPTHEAVAAAGMPILWFNPLELVVGFATEHVPGRGNQVEVLATSRTGTFNVSPLDSFTLTHSRGLTNDVLAGLLADSRRYDLWYAQEQQMLERQALAAAQAVNVRALAEAERRRKQRAAYLASVPAVELLERHGGKWPSYLDVELDDVGVDNLVWQGTLFTSLIETVNTGAHIPRAAAAKALEDLFTLDLGPGVSARLILAWFEVLERELVLTSSSRKLSRKRRAVSFYRGMQLAERQAAEDARAARAVRTAAPPVPRYTPATLWSDERPTVKVPATGYVCQSCGKPLAEIYAELGFHYACVVGARR